AKISHYTTASLLHPRAQRSPVDWLSPPLQSGWVVSLAVPYRRGRLSPLATRCCISLPEIVQQNDARNECPASPFLWRLHFPIRQTPAFLCCSFLGLSLKYTVCYSCYFFSLCCERSIITAIKITMPFTTCCQKGETPKSTKPLFSTPMITAPSTVPIIKPRPPDKDVPTITTAAIASRSYPIPALGGSESSREVTNIPPTAASIPANM